MATSNTDSDDTRERPSSVAAGVPATLQEENEAREAESGVVKEAAAAGSESSIPKKNTLQEDDRSVRPGLGRRQYGRHVVTGVAQHWTSPHSELAQIEAQHGQHSWQAKALRVIHSHRFQNMLMIALLLDVVILFTEITLAAFFPVCSIIERDAISCCPASSDEHAGETNHHDGDSRLLLRFLAASGGHHSLCEPPLEDTIYDAACDQHKHEAVHMAHIVLFSLTIVILSAFLLELLVLLAALGPSRFFRNRLYVLDTFVVVASLVLEITFKALSEGDASNLAGLLIVGRLWRYVRIGHGLFATTLEVSLHKIEEMEKQIEELKYLVEESTGALPSLSHENH